MATYDFTDSWDLGTYSIDGDTYTFTGNVLNSDYDAAIAAAQTTFAYNNQGEGGYLAPGGGGGMHTSDLQDSFGSSYGNGELDLLNYVDFDLSDNDEGEWQSMIDILGAGGTDIVGGYGTAIDAEGEGFIQVTSNFNGYNSFATDAGAEDKLFDLWHLDGLSDDDYVTAQIVEGTLTDANLSVWGEVDGYQPTASGEQIAWPFLQEDALAIDSTNMSGNHALGDYTYTLNIVTDWTECNESDYENFDWGYMQYETMSSAEFSDMNWGYIEYDEFTSSSYDDIDWGYAEFEEFSSTSYSSMDWGEVQYNEFNDTSYTSMNWGQVQYNEFDNGDYKATKWNKVQMNEFGNDDYKKLNWGKVQYKEVLKNNSNLNKVNWGKVQTNEWGKDDLKVLTKKSTDKKLDKLKNTELDINVLKKGKSFKGDKDDDVITAAGSLLKKKVNVKGGAGNDTFVLKKGKGSMVIQDFKDKVDEINFAYCGAASKIKLKQKGKDTLVYSGKDLLATVKKTKKNVLKKSAFGLV